MWHQIHLKRFCSFDKYCMLLNCEKTRLFSLLNISDSSRLKYFLVFLNEILKRTDLLIEKRTVKQKSHGKKPSPQAHMSELEMH